MKKYKFIKTLTAGVVLTVVSCPQAFSTTYPETTCSDTNGVKCWQCGNDCVATVYNNGKLLFTGSGTLGTIYKKMRDDIFNNSPVTIKSVTISEGFTTIPHDVFSGAPVSDITLPSSIEYIGSDTFSTRGGVSVLSIDENTILSNVWQQRRGSLNSNLKIICRGDIEKCENNNRDFFSGRGVAPTYTDKVLDENGRVKIKYSKDGYKEYSYDSGGNLTASYENGVVTYKRTSYTPTEAAVATKNNNNSITFTFK